MAKITNIRTAREAKARKESDRRGEQGFTPCSPDMTICGDCTDNRAKNTCPRLKEWLAKRSS